MNDNIVELIRINWLLILGTGLWVLGGTGLLTLGALYFFKEKKEDVMTPLWRKLLITASALIACGVIVSFFKVPHDQLILTAIDVPEGYTAKWQMADQQLKLFADDLQMDGMNKSHEYNRKKPKDRNMGMLWDGYIRTPFIQFKRGTYRFEFDALGTQVYGEFAKIKVELEKPDEDNLLFTPKKKYIELRNVIQTHGLEFTLETDTLARVRIVYFNDFHIHGTNKGRDVLLKNVRLSPVK